MLIAAITSTMVFLSSSVMAVDYGGSGKIISGSSPESMVLAADFTGPPLLQVQAKSDVIDGINVANVMPVDLSLSVAGASSMSKNIGMKARMMIVKAKMVIAKALAMVGGSATFGTLSSA